MELLRAPSDTPASLGILASAFDPPTIAHLALARAALRETSHVLLVLPRELPHKTFEGVCFETRLELLLAATADEPRFAVAASSGGLFIEIARECREPFGDTPLWFLCGRDAAERIVNWDYGPALSITPMLDEFGLLVADRDGPYVAPPEIAERVRPLHIDDNLDAVSSSGVRRLVGTDESWDHIVPAAIRQLVARHYGARRTITDSS